MIRVVLPAHLRTLAQVTGEVSLEIGEPVTQRSVLDALEISYPMLTRHHPRPRNLSAPSFLKVLRLWRGLVPRVPGRATP